MAGSDLKRTTTQAIRLPDGILPIIEYEACEAMFLSVMMFGAVRTGAWRINGWGQAGQAEQGHLMFSRL
jgi:hypothetical protein